MTNIPSIDISVVTTTYNRAHFLPRAWNSLRQQSAAWEWIVVDDGSTDNTAAVVASFDDSRIRYIWQAKHTGGANAGRNLGARMARGSFVVFFDDDDELYPNSLSQMVRVMTQADPNVGVAVFQCVFEAKPADLRGVIDGAVYSEADIVCGRMLGGEKLLVYRREVFDEFQLPEDLLFSEGVFVYAVAKKYQFLMVAQLGRIYHQHGGNVSRPGQIVARSKLIGMGYERILQNHAQVLSKCPSEKNNYLAKALYRYAVAGCRTDTYRIFRMVSQSGNWRQTLRATIILVFGWLGLMRRIETWRLQQVRHNLMRSSRIGADPSR